MRKQVLLAGMVFSCLFLLHVSGCSDEGQTTAVPESTGVVAKFGLLQVDGNRIVDQQGNNLAIRGMSLFWSQWIPQYYNRDCIKWLRDEWNCTVIRAAMAVDYGGYLENPQQEQAKIMQVIDACIELGIYVIVDWHDHEAEKHTEQAKLFFRSIANKYGKYPNLIYEIYNEPLQVSWKDVVKPYAGQVIAEIRRIDPDNLILVGSPNWSQDLDIVAADPIAGDNIAYSLHFYAGTHGQWLRDKAQTALDSGLALFASEWGLSEATGGGTLGYAEAALWLEFMDANQISWCNWSVGDRDESSAALKPGTDPLGNWDNLDLTPSGLYVREAIRNRNAALFEAVSGY
jgi:endoglucanase